MDTPALCDTPPIDDTCPEDDPSYDSWPFPLDRLTFHRVRAVLSELPADIEMSFVERMQLLAKLCSVAYFTGWSPQPMQSIMAVFIYPEEPERTPLFRSPSVATLIALRFAYGSMCRSGGRCYQLRDASYAPLWRHVDGTPLGADCEDSVPDADFRRWFSDVGAGVPAHVEETCQSGR